jgi:crossover junction endodeoxyribonuclease RuvC
MIIAGIDCGLNGGIALVQNGRVLIDAIDVPTTGEKAKRRVDVGYLARYLRANAPDHAFIERSQAMPEQGASSGFHYGRAVGALEAVVEALGIPSTIIEPTAWKKAHGLIRASKEDDRQRAIKLFPGTAFFDRKKDHNRADAALIARYGAMLLGEERGHLKLPQENILAAG